MIQIYQEAQRLKNDIHKIVKLCKILNDAGDELLPFYREGDKESLPADLYKNYLDCKQILHNRLSLLTREELILLRSIHGIGSSERGYRQYADHREPEIIVIPITSSHQELLEKYSKYLVYQPKEKLIKYFTERRSTSELLLQGLDVLDLNE
ncbi:hypothetical protein [Bacillus horti]|uniref:Uncharacterized protein n=1 Tax=Caldalkalibacillus horti TaxID=77523 RepID=A0ABT9W0Q6_9BACI|nr:hypothetical protein [Bacillus horti]MDQ0166840.1 hypothetical protein [Bacillus horti]